MEEEREQVIHILIEASLDGTKQQQALELMEKCILWPDYCDLLLIALERSHNKPEEEMICVLLKQAINKNKRLREREATEIILNKLEEIPKTGILVLTHIFLITNDEIRTLIFNWIINNHQLNSSIQLVSMIINDCYASIGERFHKEITIIIKLIIPKILEDNPTNTMAIVSTLKEISYSPPQEFPNLYIDLLKLLLPRVQTTNYELKLAIGRFISESPFVLSQSPSDLLEPMLQACNCLITDENEEIFISGCDLLEALISRYPEKIDPFSFKILLPRIVLNQKEESELLEGNNDEEFEISSRTSVKNLLEVAMNYYPQLIFIISPIVIENIQSSNWRIAEGSLHILTCLHQNMNEIIFQQFFKNIATILLNQLNTPFPSDSSIILLHKKIIEILGMYLQYFNQNEQKTCITILFNSLSSSNNLLLYSSLNAFIDCVTNSPQLLIPFARDIYLVLVQKLIQYNTQSSNMALDLLQDIVNITPFMTPDLLHLLVLQTVQLTPRYLNDDPLIEQLYVTTSYIVQKTRDMNVEDILPLLQSVREVLQFNWKRGVDDGAVASCIQTLDVIGQITGCGVLVHCGISEVICWGVSRKERRIQVASLMLAGRIFDNDIHSIDSQPLSVLAEKMIGILENGLHEGVVYAMWDLYLLISNLQNDVSCLFKRVINATISVYNKNVLMKPVVLKKNIVVILTTIGGLNPSLIIPYLPIITSEDLLPHVISIPNESIRFNVLRLIGLLISTAPQQCERNISCISQVFSSALKMFPHLNDIWIKIQQSFIH
ncbi:hypothetical protein ENUP19_0082G0161 [Entamoeba nuttalli]|uniref:HEAT repeat domain containing protein n=2 Tax=Entamoeba nuttalli TaxID=412467 RepID=K2GU89_ENTNP|nr:hypothetical protein ENU1_161520 [Entamoeba nuttalli P19]EKE38598.1 hypothetical protein ENU1_161520 [Entamoeba nuttalli P19]|eukprot:XP_008859068.1 hypothetical protein ENU1_161520 [Entamoeba nuttalli P19]